MLIGIDIGGTSTKLGLVDNGQVIATKRIATTDHADEFAFADALAEATRQLTTDNGQLATAIGIGAPNANQLTGIIEMAPNLPWKNDVPLAQMLQERTGIRSVLGNDANAAALGEWRYGAGQGLNDLLLVTLGTGIGSGFIVNGQLMLGSHGNAGELGHMTIAIDGRDCTCGRKGCLEAYVSIRGLRRTYMELDGDPEVLKEEGVQCIAKAAEAGDAAALQTFRHAARWLGVGLANAVAVTGPARVVLFGGLSRNGDLLMVPLQAAILGAAALTTM